MHRLRWKASWYMQKTLSSISLVLKYKSSVWAAGLKWLQNAERHESWQNSSGLQPAELNALPNCFHLEGALKINVLLQEIHFCAFPSHLYSICREMLLRFGCTIIPMLRREPESWKTVRAAVFGHQCDFSGSCGPRHFWGSGQGQSRLSFTQIFRCINIQIGVWQISGDVSAQDTLKLFCARSISSLVTSFI